VASNASRVDAEVYKNVSLIAIMSPQQITDDQGTVSAYNSDDN